MEKLIEIIRQTRINFITLVGELSPDQLNNIPQGFNNNIIWNFGHILSSQQALCNKLAGLPTTLDEAIANKYRKGTKPESYIGFDEIEKLKTHAIAAVDELAENLKNNAFTNYKPYATSYGVSLNTIEDAVKFVVAHEALHFGYAMALRKLVK